GHARLDEDGGGTGRYAGGEPVDDHVPNAVFDDLRVFVVRGERVPVGDEEEALELVLQLDPVVNDSVQVAQMQTPGRAHTGQNPPLRIDGTQACLPPGTRTLLLLVFPVAARAVARVRWAAIIAAFGWR